MRSARGSSIAVVDDHADLTLVNVDVHAGTERMAPRAWRRRRRDAGLGEERRRADDAVCNVSPCSGGPRGHQHLQGYGYRWRRWGRRYAESTAGAASTASPGDVGQRRRRADNDRPVQPGHDGAEAASGTPGIGARGIGDVSASGYQAPVATPGGIRYARSGGGGDHRRM